MTEVEWEDVQALVLTGYRHHEHSAHVIVSIKKPGAFRRWLRESFDKIHSVGDVAHARSAADDPPKRNEPVHLHVAFTRDGLHALLRAGDDTEARTLADDDLETFGDTFIEGMAPDPVKGHKTSRRAGILGDLGDNASTNWVWGGTGEGAGRRLQADVHALVMIFGETSHDVDAEIERLRGAVSDDPLVVRTKHSDREHFGFLDAISQPIIAGTPSDRERLSPAERRLHGVAPGEFILGYENEQRQYPPGPTLKRSRAADLPARNGRWDFGRNGTWLVARQLAQDVKAYNTTIEELMDPLCPIDPSTPGDPTTGWAGPDGSHGGSPGNPVPDSPDEAKGKMPGPGGLAEASGPGYRAPMRPFRGWSSEPPTALKPYEVEEKLMGRDREGVPLIRRFRPRTTDKPENDFTFHHTDAAGLVCPTGAHIRRANPRDSLDPDPDTALKLGKQHRILRRGRLYDDGDGEKGLFFVCLQADITGQFEFIQDTWISNPNFGGRTGERDPIIGALSDMTIPARPFRRRIKRERPLVTVRGGAYFFMPGLNATRYLAEEP